MPDAQLAEERRLAYLSGRFGRTSSLVGFMADLMRAERRMTVPDLDDEFERVWQSLERIKAGQ